MSLLRLHGQRREADYDPRIPEVCSKAQLCGVLWLGSRWQGTQRVESRVYQAFFVADASHVQC